jgi:hypothetical protein
MRDRQGCLAGLFELFMLNRLFDWLQQRFGFQRGGCMGCGCGMILMFVFIIVACGIFGNTDWLKLF